MDLFSLNDVQIQGIASYKQIVIEEGRTTFICGKSGCGKSTLLKLLNASISPDRGEINYRGKPIASYNTVLLRRDVILLSQNVFLFDNTIRNNFLQFYGYREQTPPTDEKIAEFLQLCSVSLSLDTNCQELSGGERQRVFVAICLSFLPKVLMLDEPTSALDESTSEALIFNLKEYCVKNKITLIAVTHDKLLAQRYADTIINMD